MYYISSIQSHITRVVITNVIYNRVLHKVYVYCDTCNIVLYFPILNRLENLETCIALSL